jgi:hypothetical protein
MTTSARIVDRGGHIQRVPRLVFTGDVARDRVGRGIEQVHERVEQMGRVPHQLHPELCTHGADIAEDGVLVDELVKLLELLREPERVVDHQLRVRFLARLDHFTGRGDLRGDGFLTPDDSRRCR